MKILSEDYYGLREIGFNTSNKPFKVECEEISFLDYLTNYKGENIIFNGYIYNYYEEVVGGKFHFISKSLDTEEIGYLTLKKSDNVLLIKNICFCHILGDLFEIAENYTNPSNLIKTYIIYDSKNELYKIGKSKNPKRRLNALSASNLNLILILVCDKNIESELHEYFSNKRRLREWFELKADDVLELIETYNFKKP